jgi:DNA-3-methyladenine glycosylase II
VTQPPISSGPYVSGLTNNSLADAARLLAKRDPDLGAILTRLGTPPLWARNPGFATLVHIILEQQVSLASARAAFNRLQAALGEVTPQGFLTLGEIELKAIGFSRQKNAYTRYLAQSILDGSLDLDSLVHLDDDAVRTVLMRIKGIGRWSADIYLLMALSRPDIWPKGDLALAVAIHDIKRLPARPGQDELDAISHQWQPYRAVAARVLWHHYLNPQVTH